MISAQQIVEEALTAAGDDGLLVVRVDDTSQANLRWAAGTMTTNGLIHSRDVDIVAFDARPRGIASATTSGTIRDRTDVQDLVQRARSAARQATAAPDAPDLVDAGVSSQWDSPSPLTDATVLRPVAGGLAEAFHRGSLDAVEHFGYAEHTITSTYLASSAGTRRRHVQVTGRMEMTAKSHGRSRSSWVGSAEVDPTRIDVSAKDSDLRRALAWQGRAVDVAPGHHRTLLSPSAVADLMAQLYWSADARSAIEGRSVFAGKGGRTTVGTALTDAPVRLSSDPHDPGPGMSCIDVATATSASDSTSPSDAGLDLSATDWIAAGRLEHLITTRESAAASALPVTPAIDNLTLHHDDGHGTLEDMAVRMSDGLLVTCLWYNRVLDPRTLLITGLTRDGVYVVRGGEIVGACGNFRHNESPVSALTRISAAGTPERTLAREFGDYFNRTTMPPLVVEDFNMSTASVAL